MDSQCILNEFPIDSGRIALHCQWDSHAISIDVGRIPNAFQCLSIDFQWNWDVFPIGFNGVLMHFGRMSIDLKRKFNAFSMGFG